MKESGNIIIVEATSDFKKVHKALIESSDIDCLTLGVYVKLITLGKKWHLNINGLSSYLKLSDTKIRKAINILEKAGYIRRTPIRNERGQCCGWNYEVYPKPIDEKERSRAGLKATEDTPTVLPENRQHGKPTRRKTDKAENGEDINILDLKDSLDLNNKREKDIDKSISKSNYQQGCGTSLPPSVAPQHLSAASSGVSSPCSSDDAFAPLTFEEEEATNKGATACGVNVNPLQTPLPPTPMMSSDVDVDDADNSNAKKSKRKKYKAKFDVYADLSYVDEAYADIWREWLEYKDAINKQYNVQKGAIIQYKSLLKYADNNVILANAIVKKSIEHSWNGLFGLSDKDKELYLSERSPYYVKSNEPKLPNGWDRERYDMYIRNGFEITEDGKLYKNGKLYK